MTAPLHPAGIRRRQLTFATALGLSGLARAQARPDLWTLLREGGCVVLMRHAQTEPGVGDPPGFRLGDCSTQRQLSQAGREQARRVGAAFTREGIRLDEVRSSAWCRCTDTADLAFGRHTAWSPINSFFQGGDGAVQTREALQSLHGLKPPRNLVLVTHQVNISSLTGEYTAMGEVLVARPGPAPDARLQVLARLVI